MNNVNNPSVEKQIFIEGKIIEKIVSKPQHVIHRHSSIRTAVVKGESIQLQDKKYVTIQNQHSQEYRPFSARNSGIGHSRTFTIKSDVLRPSSGQNRCKSAYSRLQLLKNKNQGVKPDKLFSSVSLLLDRKNSMKKNQPT